jgi:hypothetical protein
MTDTVCSRAAAARAFSGRDGHSLGQTAGHCDNSGRRLFHVCIAEKLGLRRTRQIPSACVALRTLTSRAVRKPESNRILGVSTAQRCQSIIRCKYKRRDLPENERPVAVSVLTSHFALRRRGEALDATSVQTRGIGLHGKTVGGVWGATEQLSEDPHICSIAPQTPKSHFFISMVSAWPVKMHLAPYLPPL